MHFGVALWQLTQYIGIKARINHTVTGNASLHTNQDAIMVKHIALVTVAAAALLPCFAQDTIYVVDTANVVTAYNSVRKITFTPDSVGVSFDGQVVDVRTIRWITFQPPTSVTHRQFDRPATSDASFFSRGDTKMLRIALARPGTVEVGIFSSTGRLIQRVASGRLGAGVHDIAWNGVGTAGVYVVRGTVDGAPVINKTLVKK